MSQNVSSAAALTGTFRIKCPEIRGEHYHSIIDQSMQDGVTSLLGSESQSVSSDLFMRIPSPTKRLIMDFPFI